eukprot:TRINITY_DN2159_c0_g1_i2.p1 TRINITY_DN2159_c0_g1~~TRINITY_DN2159_c0_g1_i2.p1  ORF type:complete len:223 (+),score=87.57 TRINITY_DN2159_c0_g1_i2:905-1573(+)
MAYLRIGDTVPNFQAESTAGDFDFYSFHADSWAIICSHPADFTPVCTTELGTLSKYQPEFEKRNTKVCAISVDPVDSHNNWILDINETQNTEVKYPIIADPERKVANLLGMIHPNAEDTNAGKLTVRTVFFISPDNKLKAQIVYPASTGRNFDELVRVIDSLQLTVYNKVATPANWNKGDKVVIVPSVNNEDAENLFPGYETVKPYLRLTEDTFSNNDNNSN